MRLVEWSGVEWSGVERSGAEWSGVEWSGVWRQGACMKFRDTARHAALHCRLQALALRALCSTRNHTLADGERTCEDAGRPQLHICA